MPLTVSHAGRQPGHLTGDCNSGLQASHVSMSCHLLDTQSRRLPGSRVLQQAHCYRSTCMSLYIKHAGCTRTWHPQPTSPKQPGAPACCGPPPAGAPVLHCRLRACTANYLKTDKCRAWICQAGQTAWTLLLRLHVLWCSMPLSIQTFTRGDRCWLFPGPLPTGSAVTAWHCRLHKGTSSLLLLSTGLHRSAGCLTGHICRDAPVVQSYMPAGHCLA